MKAIGSILAGLFTVAFGAAFIYAEIAGIIYPCKYESTGSCVGSIILPPYAWWKAIDYTFFRPSGPKVVIYQP